MAKSKQIKIQPLPRDAQTSKSVEDEASIVYLAFEELDDSIK
jgi:hypothetical protein